MINKVGIKIDPKQCRVELFRKEKLMPCNCNCKQEQLAAREQARKEQQRLGCISRLKANGLQDRALFAYTFAAACIAKALNEQGVPVLMTNFSKILNTLSGMFSEERNKYLASFSEFDLLIITTNLTLAALKDPKDIAHARIYDRILERCAPVGFGGKNYRTVNAEYTKNAIREIFTQEDSL